MPTIQITVDESSIEDIEKWADEINATVKRLRELTEKLPELKIHATAKD